MKSKKLKFRILILFIFISIIFGYKITENNLTAQDSSISEQEEELLERAIIIDGLKLETDNEIEINKIKKSKKEKVFLDKDSKKTKTRKVQTKKIFLSELKKKNKKWHYTKYKIRKGDNLWEIADKFNISYKYIIRANKITNPDMLRPGNLINVPNKNGISYIIKKGDTLTSIAQKFKVTIKSIVEHNRINSDKINTGSTLFIPDAQKHENISNKNRKKKFIVKNITSKKNNTNNTNNVKIVNKNSRLKFIWPMNGKITSAFGIRNDPFTGRKKFHCGIDIGANEGTRVSASAKGTVIFSGWKNGYGKVIVIQHKGGYITVYAHLSKLLKKVDQKVNSEDVIALSGKTGAVTGAHLHFEIRKYLTPLNPIRLFKR